MKTKVFLLFIFIIVAIVSIFVFLNPTRVPLYIAPGNKFELPVSIVILGSVIFGFLGMLTISLFREIKMGIDIRKLRKTLNNINKSKEYIKNGLIELFSGNKKSAQKNFYNAVKLDENLAYYIITKDIEENIEKQEEIINKLPYDINRFYLIEYYFNNGKYAALINIANELLSEKEIKNKKILSLIRDSFKKLEKFKEAINIQEKILSLKNINKAKEIINLAELFYLDAKKENTFEKITNLIKKFPKLRPGYFLKYNYSKKENPIEALKILKEGYSNTNDTTFLCEIINILEENSDEKLLKNAEKILYKVKDKKAELLLSIIYFLNNNLAKAEQIVKKYLEDKELSNLATLIYAEILYRKDMDLKEVIELFRKVLNTQGGIHFKFYCTNCKTKFQHWIDYCPNCKQFDTVYSIFEKGEDNGF